MPPRYHVFLDGEVTAPFPESVIFSMLNSGTLNEDSLLCREGEDAWDKAKRMVGWERKKLSMPERPAAIPRSTPQVIYVQQSPPEKVPFHKTVSGAGCLILVVMLALLGLAVGFRAVNRVVLGAVHVMHGQQV